MNVLTTSGLSQLAASQLPNILGVLIAACVAAIAMIAKTRLKWGFVAAVGIFAAAVIFKNGAYWLLVSGKETDSTAWNGYVDALQWVCGLQITAAFIFVATALGQKKLIGSAIAAACACLLAAFCMLGWQAAYMGDASQPVEHVLLWAPAVWLLFMGIVVGFVADIILKLRRNRERTHGTFE